MYSDEKMTAKERKRTHSGILHDALYGYNAVLSLFALLELSTFF